MESSDIKDHDHVMYLQVLGLSLEHYWRTYDEKSDFASIEPLFEDIMIAYIFKRMNMYKDEKNAADTMLCLTCLRYILLILEKMTASTPEAKEHSMRVQAQLFYHEGFLYQLAGLCRSFHNQVVPKK